MASLFVTLFLVALFPFTKHSHSRLLKMSNLEDVAFAYVRRQINAGSKLFFLNGKS